MAIAESKITSQGQISVPAAVRQKLGVGPGSTIEWVEKDGQIVVQRVGKYTFADIRKVLFGKKPPRPFTNAELKEGIEKYIREKHGHLRRDK